MEFYIHYTTLQVFFIKKYRTGSFWCIMSLLKPIQKKVTLYDELIIQQRQPDW